MSLPYAQTGGPDHDQDGSAQDTRTAVEKQQDHIRALLGQLNVPVSPTGEEGTILGTKDEPEGEDDGDQDDNLLPALLLRGSHIPSAGVVRRADDQLSVLDDLLEEQRRILLETQEQRIGLMSIHQREENQANLWREMLPNVERDLATARATLTLVQESDSEDAVRTRIEGLEDQQSDLIAKLSKFSHGQALREAVHTSSVRGLDKRIETTKAAIVSLQDQMDAMERARAEAHAQAGEDAASEIVADIEERQRIILSLRAELEETEQELAELRQNIKTLLRNWPTIAARVASRYDVKPRPTAEAELVKRWIAFVEYLDQNGKKVGAYSQVGHVNLMTHLPLSEQDIKLALANESGATAGNALRKKIDAVRPAARGTEN